MTTPNERRSSQQQGVESRALLSWPGLQERTWTQSVVPGGDASSLRHHALHPEGFFRVVEAEEGRLAKTQHAACKNKHLVSVFTRVFGRFSGKSFVFLTFKNQQIHLMRHNIADTPIKPGQKQDV